jgi:hypothetical protein
MLFTPPLTPKTFPEEQDTSARPIRYQRRTPRLRSQLDGDVSPEFVLPPPLEPVPLVLPEPSLPYSRPSSEYVLPPPEQVDQEWTYSRDMSSSERNSREEWLAGGRGRRGLRIVIVTGTSILVHDWLISRELSAMY